MKEIKFRAFCEVDTEEGTFNAMMYYEPIKCDNGLWFNAPDNVYHINEYFEIMQFTGLQDKNGVDIYESDVLSDVVITDEGEIKSKEKVFWNQPTGSWHLDQSFKQDEFYSTDLWLELNDFNYEVIGNIHQL